MDTIERSQTHHTFVVEREFPVPVARVWSALRRRRASPVVGRRGLEGRHMSTSITTMALVPTGAGTRLTFTEQGVHFGGLDSPEGREHRPAGILDTLGEYLASGTAQRAAGSSHGGQPALLQVRRVDPVDPLEGFGALDRVGRLVGLDRVGRVLRLGVLDRVVPELRLGSQRAVEPVGDVVAESRGCVDCPGERPLGKLDDRVRRRATG